MRTLLALGLSLLLAACSGSNDDERSPSAGVGGSGKPPGTSGSGGTGNGNSGGSGGGGNGTSTGGSGGEPVTFGPDGWSPSSTETPHFYRQPDDSFDVRAARPRLFFRKEDVDFIKQRGQGALSGPWKYLATMASQMVAQSPSSSYATNDVKGWFGEKGQAVAFFGFMNDDDAYVDWAVAWAKALGQGAVPSDDTPLRARCQRIAVVYDWLHDRMSEADREEIRGYLVKYVEALGGMGIIEDPGYTGGHERWGYAVYAMGLIALAGDYDQAETRLASTRDHITQGFFPTQAWIASDGGYHMGWAYTAAYSNFDLPYWIWTVGTNDVVLDDWMTQTSYYNLYGMRGDDAYPEAGDAFSVDLDLGSANAIYAAGVGKNGHAKWFLDEKLSDNIDPFLQVLMVDPSVAAEPPEALPLGRLFKQAGVVIARDRWDAATTHFTFKSGAFYSTNHHHRDENTFTLHYKGLLAIDSGVYDSYGSTHWKNYYTRTVAHNGILVRDPNQQMTLYGAAVSNDGGQVFRGDPNTLDDIKPGGLASLDGIVRFESTDAYTYALGDATQAYDPARVSLAQRDIVYLRKTTHPHPVVLIFDRVGATDASFKKTFLLHTAEKPSISGKTTVSSENDGRLTTLTLYPTNAVLGLVGGAGQEFAVNGKNYPPTKTELVPGSWRLEVSPPAGSKTDFMLHALFVDDAGAPPVPANAATLVSGNEIVGTELGGFTVVFPKSSAGIAGASYTVSKGGTTTHLVTGLSPGSSVTFSVNGSTQGQTVVGQTIVGPGGCAALELSVPPAATIAVQ